MQPIKQNSMKFKNQKVVKLIDRLFPECTYISTYAIPAEMNETHMKINKSKLISYSKKKSTLLTPRTNTNLKNMS